MSWQEAITPERVERAREAVFARAEFGDPDPPFIARIYEQILEWIGQGVLWLIERLFGIIGGLRALEGASSLIFWLLVVLTAALFAGGLHSIWRTLQRKQRLAVAAALPPESEHAGAPTEPEEWEARARSATAEGRLIEAAHALYAALVLRLQSRGVVHVDPSKTPGDYRREADRRDPQAASLLGAFLHFFEPFVFGGRVPEAGPLEQMAREARRGGVRV